MAVDIVALLRVEVISITRVRVIYERLLRATRLSMERNSLPVARSPSVFFVRLESLGVRIASCIIVDLESLFHAGAVTTAVGLDANCEAALNEDGGGGDKELGKMHFQRCSKNQECFS